MSQGKTAVIVDDDAIIGVALEVMCRRIGVTVLGVAQNASEADRMLASETPDFVLMDVRLGEARDGIDVANDYHSNHPQSKIIYVTGSHFPDGRDIGAVLTSRVSPVVTNRGPA